MRVRTTVLVYGLCAGSAIAQGQRLLSREDYADRLRAMWLGQVIANWTGLRTEGRRQEPPFLTDEDWGRVDLGRGLVTFVLDQDPWQADDDTDIEYVYLHLLTGSGLNRLSPGVIAQGWVDHINRFIWVSNFKARELMGRGVRPPATGMGTANQFWLRIDAQLTTEFFGLLCPGMPDRALEMSDLPMRTTSAGYATHASQAYAVMYALASQAPPGLSGRDRAVWLVTESRRYIPDTSKSADIMDAVLADFVSNPDANNWERTRDLIYDRYQLNAAANGFRYRAWTESSVNFACGVMALLYGQGDFGRTVQVGTLSGWDSDNGTATMGALLGFMLGYDALVAQFPGQPFSDRFWVFRTRDNLPDHLPEDPSAEDTFTLMAQRMIPVVEREILAAGGLVSDDGEWLLPPPHSAAALEVNPVQALDARSANVQVVRAGGTASGSSSATGASPPAQRGTPLPSRIADGFEHDFSGRETTVDAARWYYSSQGSSAAVVELTVAYDRDVLAGTVRFIEGDHFDDSQGRGGWFESLTVELLVGGAWTPVSAQPSEPLDQARPFQVVDFALPNPVAARGVRVRGPAGGPDRFVTCAELDCLAPRTPLPTRRFDLTGDGLVDAMDLYKFAVSPVDLNGDGSVDTQDQKYLETAARWQETRNMAGSQRP